MPNLGILLRPLLPVICYTNDFYRWSFVKEVLPFINLKFAAFHCLFIHLCSYEKCHTEAAWCMFTVPNMPLYESILFWIWIAPTFSVSYVVLWADIPKQISSSFLQSPSLSRNLKTKFKIENWWTGQDVTEKKYHDRSKKGEKTAGRKGRAIFCVSIKGEKRQWKNVTEQCQEMLNIWLHKCCVFFISRVLTACPHASVLPPAFPTISYR